MEFSIHPVANMLPPMSEIEMEALKEGIKRDGQIVPILAIGDQIIDGRHRYWACRQLGITPNVQEWTGSKDLKDLIHATLALNIKRRHLTQGQKAALAVNSIALFEEAASERERAGVPGAPDALRGKSAALAAGVFGVSPRYVEYAKTLKQWDEACFSAVIDGKLALTEAGKIMRKQLKDQEDQMAGDTESFEDKPLRVPAPPVKWDADVKYEIWAGGVHTKTLFFNSDMLAWDMTTHEA